jgi:hypothetical protein
VLAAQTPKLYTSGRAENEATEIREKIFSKQQDESIAFA